MGLTGYKINLLNNIKSKYILKKIFNNVQKKKILNIIKFNKSIKDKLGIEINDYEKYSNVIIEIIPVEVKLGKIKKIIDIYSYDFKYCKIIMTDDKNDNYEIHGVYIYPEDNAEKITITLDYRFDRYKYLFSKCDGIKSVNFIKYYRKDINDISHMFRECHNLEQANISNINLDSVIDMSYLFAFCNKLYKVNLSNLNTNKVRNLSYMFCKCNSLEYLNVSNFNTDNAIDMYYMFHKCFNLEKLNIESFNTSKVNNMIHMFSFCYSLKELNISSNFTTKNVKYMHRMLYNCNEEAIKKIKNQCDYIKESAFL